MGIQANLGDYVAQSIYATSKIRVHFHEFPDFSILCFSTLIIEAL
jgi:hypothetical protein